MGKIRKFTLLRSLQSLAVYLLCFSILTPAACADSTVFQTRDAGPVLLSLFKKNKGTQIDISSVLVTDAVMPDGIPGTDVSASGVAAQWGENSVIDYSNVSDGYVMVCYTAETDYKIKVQIESQDVKYTYTLTPNVWTAFPLSEGSGYYAVTVLEGVGESRYALLLSADFYAEITDEFAPFLRSNQYVNYAAAPNAVATASNLVSETGDTIDTVSKVYSFVVSFLEYDEELAETVTSGYVPDLDTVLVKREGICFDYASLMTGMLRSLRIPCKLVVGYADELYHAWISVWVDGEGWISNIIHFNGKEWQFMDPTFASAGYKGDTVYAARFFY